MVINGHQWSKIVVLGQHLQVPPGFMPRPVGCGSETV